MNNEFHSVSFIEERGDFGVNIEKTPRFNRLCAIFVAVQWIGFGVMHFTSKKQTAMMIPDFVTGIGDTLLKTDSTDFISISTGMLEVAIGILLLIPAARKPAAWASLALIILYIPAVYTILTLSSEGGAWILPMQALVVPNNILLALISLHLARYPNAGVFPVTAEFEARLNRPFLKLPKLTTGRATLLTAAVMLASNCAGFLAIYTRNTFGYSTAVMWALMCLCLGALIGFLFAVPKSNPEHSSKQPFFANTNIELISDWATKIVIGLGLIHVTEIGQFLDTKSQELNVTLQVPDGSGADHTLFAQALIVYFFVLGLIQGYLLTRMFLTGQFNASSDPQVEAAEAKD